LRINSARSACRIAALRIRAAFPSSTAVCPHALPVAAANTAANTNRFIPFPLVAGHECGR
jgi:hypothetical protein